MDGQTEERITTTPANAAEGTRYNAPEVGPNTSWGLLFLQATSANLKQHMQECTKQLEETVTMLSGKLAKSEASNRILQDHVRRFKGHVQRMEASQSDKPVVSMGYSQSFQEDTDVSLLAHRRDMGH